MSKMAEELAHWHVATVSLSALATLLAIRLSQCLPIYRGRGRGTRKQRPVPTLVFWGSGGHTTEMLRLLSELKGANYQPLHFVLSHSDTTSKDKILAARLPFQHLASWHTVFRGREVKQSWMSTVFTSMQSLAASFWLVWRLRPGVIICNGPGTCVLLCYAAFALRLLGVCQPVIIFVESFCRVTSLSLSGKLLYPIADKFVVQWPALADKYGKAEYMGRIC